MRWLDVEPCYVYHPVNAYDDEDTIVADVVRHATTFAVDRHGPADSAPTLDRWTIDLSAGKVREERLHDRAQEFPRIDDRVTGHKARYGYTVGFDLLAPGALSITDAVFKHDLSTATSQLRRLGAGREVGEMVFVPSGADAAEDDGVLIGLVHDAARAASDLVILDAASLGTVATVHLPVRVPHGFHGSWIPTESRA